MLQSLSILDRLQDCFDAVSDGQVRQLEADLGVEFPADYREFLLAFNAGYWRHEVACRVRQPDYWVNELYLKRSMGIVSDQRFWLHDIKSNCENYAGYVRGDLIPIMHPIAYSIFIATAPEEFGKIYVWADPRDNGDGNLYLISDSFSEFLRSLYVVEDKESFVEKLPVFQAVERGQAKLLREFLDDGGKVDCRNANGHTLVMCAARKSWPKLVRLLLERGANPNTIDHKKLSPLYHAVWGQSNDSVKLLLAAGADAHFCDPQGQNLAAFAGESHFYRQQYTIEDFWQRERRG